MEPLELLYIALTVFVVIFIIVFLYISILLITLLRRIQFLLDRLEDAGQNLKIAKSAAQTGFWTVIEKLISKLTETKE